MRKGEDGQVGQLRDRGSTGPDPQGALAGVDGEMEQRDREIGPRRWRRRHGAAEPRQAAGVTFDPPFEVLSLS